MAKSKLITPSNFGILGSTGEEIRHVPKIKGVAPTGSQILIELLTPQELMGTNFFVGEKVDTKVPMQGYIRAMGPGVKTSDWGFSVGNRVLISGSGVMAPNYDNSYRERFFMEPHAIKAVLTEDMDG